MKAEDIKQSLSESFTEEEIEFIVESGLLQSVVKEVRRKQFGSLENSIRKRIVENLTKPYKITKKPGMTDDEYEVLQPKEQQKTSAMKSVDTHEPNKGEAPALLDDILKGNYAWGKVNPTLAKVAISTIRTLDPKVRRHIIPEIYYNEEAFDKLVLEGKID